MVDTYAFEFSGVYRLLVLFNTLHNQYATDGAMLCCLVIKIISPKVLICSGKHYTNSTHLFSLK